MASLFDWSATPASNTTVNGINIAEGMSPALVNDAMRSIMALVRSSFDTSLQTFLANTAQLPIANGGTGAATAAAALTALGASPARPTITTQSTSFSAADSDNNTHKVASGTSPTLTLGTITAGTAFTARFTTAWSITCSGGLSKNGASPSGVTTGSIAANSLLTFIHEGSGVWSAIGSGLS